MKHIIIFILFMFPCGAFAQDHENLDEQIGHLDEQISQWSNKKLELQKSVRENKTKLDSLKFAWYHTCVNYLKAGQFKVEELKELCDSTYSEIDGNPLYNELVKAYYACQKDTAYTFSEVPPPCSRKFSIPNHRTSSSSDSGERPPLTTPLDNNLKKVSDKSSSLSSPRRVSEETRERKYDSYGEKVK